MNDNQNQNSEGFPGEIFSQSEEIVRAYIENDLKNDDHWIRANALESISIAECSELIDIVISCLGDKHGWVRGKAAEVLGKFRAEEATIDIIKCIEKDDDVMVRLSAVWALGEIGDKRALEILGEVQSGKYSHDGQVSYLEVADLEDVIKNQLVNEAENSIKKIQSSDAG
jgi:HEAT repeat protein